MPVAMKPTSLKPAPSTMKVPSAIMSATRKRWPSGVTRMSCGIPPFDSFSSPITRRCTMSIFASAPENSHVKIA